MRSAYTIALASAAALALGGAAAWAGGNSHVLNITLPDGVHERIFYFGDAPPKVSFERAPLAPAAFADPLAFADPFAVNGPFARLDRMSAAMDRQAAWMMSHAPVAPLAPGGTLHVAFGALPPGVSGYSVVTTVNGGKVCSRSTEYMASKGGAAPRVVTRVSGCDARAGAASPAAPAVSMPSAAAATNGHAAGFTQTSYVTTPAEN